MTLRSTTTGGGPGLAGGRPAGVAQSRTSNTAKIKPRQPHCTFAMPQAPLCLLGTSTHAATYVRLGHPHNRAGPLVAYVQEGTSTSGMPDVTPDLLQQTWKDTCVPSIVACLPVCLPAFHRHGLPTPAASRYLPQLLIRSTISRFSRHPAVLTPSLFVISLNSLTDMFSRGLAAAAPAPAAAAPAPAAAGAAARACGGGGGGEAAAAPAWVAALSALLPPPPPLRPARRHHSPAREKALEFGSAHLVSSIPPRPLAGGAAAAPAPAPAPR